MYLDFFFQAEDGIRDSPVTGVQTCALPIYKAAGLLKGKVPSLPFGGGGELDIGVGAPSGFDPEIGRASCRERV